MKVIEDTRVERLITIQLTESELAEIVAGFGCTSVSDRGDLLRGMGCSTRVRHDTKLYEGLKGLLQRGND